MSRPEGGVLAVDEPNIVDVVTMALRFQGFEVASAGTGADALATVSGFRPDLILLDVMLSAGRPPTRGGGAVFSVVLPAVDQRRAGEAGRGGGSGETTAG
jgi:CheY-like chemotaxis protein